ncbi:hypothetical protein [Pseudorhodoferax sp.]|jgi:hypothetical protein|uniref:hypothetical protein n=1 Tax=Pseudorhodoferax sp. TaxID=1993553 RepID=UPI002DD63CA9|nr:hypothetical protein [Pseudorhodoferax sp.]
MKRRLLCLALLPTLTPAQTTRQQSRPVYRCGNAVSDRPCRADAPASAVAYDQPSAADQQATRQRSQREAREAEQLQAERERRERRPQPGAARLDAPKAPERPASAAAASKTAKSPKTAKPRKPAKPRAPTQPRRGKGQPATSSRSP